ncbi:MAG TPA: hypothetical protein DCM86_11035 [Verrucomicrobiales bacterium]|nr:hypothetical protein [Verrucomicrobiales bacterium]
MHRPVLSVWVLLFAALGAVAATPPPTLINVGESWSYVKVPYAIDSPAPAWTSPDFDDTRWKSAKSEFSLEHPHLSIQGVLPRKAPSRVFMRRRFTVEDPAGIQTLHLKVEHEQGFKAFLNGQLVATVTGEGISIVKSDIGVPGEEQVLLDIADLDLSPYRSLLRRGENLLALQGDQSYQTASTISLAALLTANISRGPFLQSMTTTNVLIVWRTDLPLDSTVEWGPTPGLGQRITDPGPATNHVINLTGLTPDSTYYYRVVSAGPDAVVVQSPVDFLHTFKDRGAVSFVFLGDSGQNTPAQGAVAQAMAGLRPDLVLHGGDIVYGGFDDKTPDTRVFGYYQKLTGQMQNTPFYFTIGNHDLNCCGGTPELNLTNWVQNGVSFQRTFYLPTNSLTGTSHFYSFDDGDVHFVSLYNPWGYVYTFSQTNAQYSWLTNDLATTRKPWKVLFFHAPIANSGRHALEDGNANSIPDQQEAMAAIGTAAAQYGVQLVLCAHEHVYERFLPTNGVHTVNSGGGGAALYEFLKRHPQSAQFNAVNHCLKIDIAGEAATIQAVRADGTVFDSWVVSQGLPLDPLHRAAWNSPLVEEAAANDKDGNINGQTFDFVGKPILGRHGLFSNPGWCYVNNDSTNLYIGLASALLYPNQTFVLFVESPRLPGVSDMAGVGNGVIDPLGQGVDGLDTLKNLRFVDFHPSVGCLLGDEFGDTTTNQFVRAGLALNTGQGAWTLEPAPRPVAGARIQQFNRSPQTNQVSLASTGADKESNADFIEVALPFTSLGGILPGDTVRIALVAATGEPDTATMTRAIDTTLVGTSMVTTPDGFVQIAPVQVRLALPPDLDSDHDGLPDEWEIAHGLRPDSADGVNGADGDPDGDGSSNIQEYLAGTDPQDPASVLRVALNPINSTRLRIEWPMVPGKSYVLQYAVEGVDNFSTLLRTNLAPRSLFTRGSIVEDALAPGGPGMKVYRVQLDP